VPYPRPGTATDVNVRAIHTKVSDLAAQRSFMPFHKLYYHFIWGTKNRLPIILPEFESELHRAIAAKSIDLEGFVYAIDGIEDHVHLAVSVPPKIALSRFIGEIKGNTSHFVNYVIKPDLEFYWQEEYGVLSFGEKNLSAIVKYIHNQKHHHAGGTVQSQLEQVSL
jgi:putative transposase